MRRKVGGGGEKRETNGAGVLRGSGLGELMVVIYEGGMIVEGCAWEVYLC